MKNNKIIHFTEKFYDIGKGLSNEFHEFQLHYNENVLAGNVKVLKGGFMNIGRHGLNDLKNKEDIKLILPKGCIFKAIRVYPSSKDLEVTPELDSNKKNEVYFGINEKFLTNDYFKYTAIIESFNDIDDLHKNLKFHHRLLDTDEIDNTYIENMNISNSIRKVMKMILYFFILLSMMGIYSSIFKPFDFEVIDKRTNREVYIYIDPRSQLYVFDGPVIPYITGSKLSSDNFLKDYTINPIVTYTWFHRKLLFFILLFIFFIFYWSYFYYNYWVRNSRILRILTKEYE